MNITKEDIMINNTRQNILTLYSDRNNPVLLIVHGGPGSPDRPLVCEYNSELANYFTVVCWDQRGSGLSYSKKNKREPLSIELMLSDLKELVIYLTEEYKQDKIYIAGHSWGAYLGLKFVKKYPQYVRYYIGTGQGISSTEDEIDKYNFVKAQAEKADDDKILRKLEHFGKPDGMRYQHDTENARKLVGKLIHKYGGYIHPKSGFSMNLYLSLYLKHYGINTLKVLKGINYSVSRLTPMVELDNSIPEIKLLDVPILFIFGEQDYICPVPTAKRWFDNLSAPKKKFVVIPDAAHMVNFEQAVAWNNEIIKNCIWQETSPCSTEFQEHCL